MNSDYNSQPVWFREPAQTDDTHAFRGELTTDYLKRSTVSRAKECRRFLNENLAMLPVEHHATLYRALHDRWHSAFFELIVARTLQALGADIEVEPDSEAGTRIDFVARFPDSAISVEAVAPVFDADAGEAVKRRTPLLKIIESLTPPGWRVMVVELPDLGLDDSKRRFKNVVRGLLDALPPEAGSEPRNLSAELPSGEVRLRVLPKREPVFPGEPVVVADPALTVVDNSEQRIRRAIKRKRRQGRNVETPAILAVHATGISSEFHDFDLALFGREVGFFDGEKRSIARTWFQADGAFNKGSNEPTFAAVLAFVNVNFPGGPDPVLYLHPRFRGNLPASLMSVERRSYDPETKTMMVQPSQKTGFLKQLGFVSV